MVATYLNKPRFSVYDHLQVPVGPVREFNGLKGYWMGLGLIPKDAKVNEPGWLTYRRSPMGGSRPGDHLRGRQAGLRPGRSRRQAVGDEVVRDDHGQTYKSLSTLGERYQRLPTGWTFRVAELDRDLVLAPTKAGGTATIMQDEFENTYDFLGDGSSSFLP